MKLSLGIIWCPVHLWQHHAETCDLRRYDIAEICVISEEITDKYYLRSESWLEPHNAFLRWWSMRGLQNEIIFRLITQLCLFVMLIRNTRNIPSKSFSDKNSRINEFLLHLMCPSTLLNFNVSLAISLSPSANGTFPVPFRGPPSSGRSPKGP